MIPSPWHAAETEAVVSHFHSSLDTGLSWAQASRRRQPAPDGGPSQATLALRTLANQLRGSVVIVLLVTAVAFWVLGHRDDAIGIGASVIFAVVLGFLIDFRAEHALAALKALNTPMARVLREGREHEIPAADLCAGDIAVLTAGHRIPADGRLAEVRALSVDESVLTGESAPVDKSTAALRVDQPIAERANMVFAGTTAIQGYGRMVVTAVGADSELGRLGLLMRQQEKKTTPLEQAADQLGRQLAVLVAGLSAAIIVLGTARGQPFWLMVETGFLLAVAAIPEGLPAVTTVALASGVHRMVRARCVVRKLASVEALGAVTVFCTDKTGTLTENRMAVARLVSPAGDFNVTGSGYGPEGAVSRDGVVTEAAHDRILQTALTIAVLCNNAVLERHAEPAGNDDSRRNGEAAAGSGTWHIHGSPTEGALLALALKAGLDPDALRQRHRRLHEIPFSSVTKTMTVVAGDEAGIRCAYVKGAVQAVLPACTRKETRAGVEPITAEDVARIEVLANDLGASGHRVLALAYRRLDDAPASAAPDTTLIWAGLAALIDPPRKEAPDAIGSLKRAGVRTVMLTGDQKATALAIARRLGLGDGVPRCMETRELNDVMARGAWDELRDVAVFARISPEDKLNIVRALQSTGAVVAMTGDGANDAPALKAADIGLAMGAGAVDVAKEAADIVVTDGNYASMAAAIGEGRRVYGNIQKAVRFLMLCSFAEISLLLEATIAGVALPLSPLQILWLNLVVHIFPAVGLAVISSDREVMDRPPRGRGERLLSWRETARLGVDSLLISGGVFGVYLHFHGAALDLARTLAMVTLAMSLLLQIFPRVTGIVPFTRAPQAWETPPWLGFLGGVAVLLTCVYQPALSRLLHTVALAPAQWALPLAVAGACLLVLEAVKAARPSQRRPR